MTHSVSLTLSNPVELSNFMALEQHEDAAEFVTQNSLKEHLKAFFDPSITYLTIVADDKPAGFMLLKHDVDQISIELRRFVVDGKERGVGQQAMGLLEAYVSEEFDCKRIWLDVFTNNARAIYLYQKLGYRQFGTDVYHDGRILLLFEKHLG